MHNVGHASLLVLGLAQGDWDLVSEGLHDRLHQPRRQPLYPQSMALLRRAPGAGRARRDDLRRRAVRAVLDPLRGDGRGDGALKPATAGWATVMHVPFEPQGADVREL